MDPAQQEGHDEETEPSTTLVRPTPEQIRYLQMPAGPAVVNFPPYFRDILLENRLAQTATVDQQRELMLSTRGLNEWMGREVEERHDDLRRLRALFQQTLQDVRDWQDEEEEEEETSTSDDGLESVNRSAVLPQQPPAMPANPQYPMIKRPVVPPVLPNQPSPMGPQPQPVVVMLPGVYAPRPIPAASRQAHPLRQFTTSPVPVPPRTGLGSNAAIVPENFSSSPGQGTPGNHSGISHRRSINQHFPRQSMGSDVNIVPLSTSSARSHSPTRATGRLAPRGSVASLRGRGVLQRIPSSMSQRSPLIVPNSSSPMPTGHPYFGPVLPTPQLPPVVRTRASPPIAAMQQVTRPQPSPSPAVIPTSGPRLLKTRPPPGPMPVRGFSPIPAPNARAFRPVLMPRAAHGPQVISQPQPLTIARQPIPVSDHMQVRAPYQVTQPGVMKEPPTRLSKRRPQPPMAVPMPGIPPHPIGGPPPQPDTILMPKRTESIRNRQNRRQLRPIDTSVGVPPAAVSAMTYPQTSSHVRTTVRYSGTPLILPQSSGSSNRDFWRPTHAGEQPIVIPTSPLRSSSRHRTNLPIQAAQPVVRQTSPSRLTRRHRPGPTTADPRRVVLPISRTPSPPRPEAVLMPARSESMRHHQSRRQIRPIGRSTLMPVSGVSEMTYPESVARTRLLAQRAPTPFITQRSLESSDGSGSSTEAAGRPAVIRRSSSRLSIRHDQQQTRPVVMKTSQSRLTKRRPQPTTGDSQPVVLPISRTPSPQHEVSLMPARSESMHRQSRHQLRPIDRSTFVPTSSVTAMTYPETVSHVQTTRPRPPTPFIVQQSSPVSSDGSSRSSMEGAQRSIRRFPSRSSSHYGPQPTQPVVMKTSQSRLTKPRHSTMVEPQSVVLPISNRTPSPSQPEVVLMPARTDSMRNRPSHHQLRPVDTSTGIQTSTVTAMMYPESVGHVRTGLRPPTPFIPPRLDPVSSDNSSRSPIQATERPALLRRTQSRSSIRHESQPAVAIPIPVMPPSQPIGNIISSSGPGIVVMPLRSESRRGRRNQPSSDSSTVVLSAGSDEDSDRMPAAEGSNDIGSGVIAGPRSVPQSGAVVVPLDSEAEETMGMRPPTLSRQTSFAGRDWVKYSSRSSSTGSYRERRSYSSEDSTSHPVTPTFRGRSKSPRVLVAGSRSPSRIRRSASTNIWDRKSRSRSQRGWYRRRSKSPDSLYGNSLLHPPAGKTRGVSGTAPIRKREDPRTFGTQATAVGVGAQAGRRLERERTGIMLGPDSRPQRTQKSWFTTWMGNL